MTEPQEWQEGYGSGVPKMCEVGYGMTVEHERLVLLQFFQDLGEDRLMAVPPQEARRLGQMLIEAADNAEKLEEPG
jgi:hypothetical protein